MGPEVNLVNGNEVCKLEYDDSEAKRKVRFVMLDTTVLR